jgi:hypothetical protein
LHSIPKDEERNIERTPTTVLAFSLLFDLIHKPKGWGNMLFRNLYEILINEELLERKVAAPF